jgi:outer membrane immunogenic protein
MRNYAISLSALFALIAPAAAEQKIGAATQIEQYVEGVDGNNAMRLKVGDEVYFNELLTTGVDSRGKFIFDDRANLQMGPSSQVKLDSFVYASAPAVVFNAAKGAFRFVSAPGGHKAYEVRTPKASIAVRGTAFGVRTTIERTDAVLYDGSIEVCLPSGGGCRVLDKPCTFVTVTDAGFTTTTEVGPNDWSFDDACKPKPAQRRRHGSADPPRVDPPRKLAPPVRAAFTPPTIHHVGNATPRPRIVRAEQP